MSSGTAANCGHVLEVTTPNIVKLGIDLSDYSKEYKGWMKDSSEKNLADFVNFLFVEHGQESFKMKLGGIEREAFVYRHDDGDIYDDLEGGVLYFMFSTHDIFTMEKTSFGEMLEERDASPRWAVWTTFG